MEAERWASCMQDLDNFKKEVLLMSRICHPNVISLRAARVLPPGEHTHLCSSLSRPVATLLNAGTSYTAAMHVRFVLNCCRLHAGDAAGGRQHRSHAASAGVQSPLCAWKQGLLVMIWS